MISSIICIFMDNTIFANKLTGTAHIDLAVDAPTAADGLGLQYLKLFSTDRQYQKMYKITYFEA